MPVNTRHWDNWSFVHLGSGVIAGWIMDPMIAFVILALYEPIEIFLIAPFLYRRFGIIFGNEAWNNAFVDIIFNTVGILIGYGIIRSVMAPPLILF